MRNILLTISYDGTDFCGWQRQDFADKGKAVRTVQQTVEDALEKLHKQKISLQGSGRTDSGVHAFAQAANFYSPVDSIPIEKYQPQNTANHKKRPSLRRKTVFHFQWFKIVSF